MKQIIQNVRDGKLKVVEVPAPMVRPGHVLVRTAASLISAGTERMIGEFARRSLVGKAQARPDLVRKVIDKARRDGIAATLRSVRARLDEPLPLGYSACGIVTAIGSGLEGTFRIGQRVAMAGAGTANHAEINVVPENLLAAVPADVDDEAAAFTTLAAIALHGIRNLDVGLGDVVAVVGAGLVGLIAVQLLSLAGARVIAVDIDPARLEIARRFGAELAIEIGGEGAVGAVSALTRGRGVDGILIAAASDDNLPLVFAADIARDRARVSIIGKVGTEFPFAEYMKKELSIVVSRSYGPGRYDQEFETDGVKYPVGFVHWTEADNLAECARLMSPSLPRHLNMTPLVTHRFDIANAEGAYALVLDRVEPHLGVILRYPPAAEVKSAGIVSAPRASVGGGTIGVIGAGAYARSVLLPIVKSLPGVRLRTVVTTRGATAEHARHSFGFEQAGSDPRLVFEDPAIDAVIVATPHRTHAKLVVAALAAGKAVFVEKPLGLARSELAEIVSARNAAKRFFTVGFNRRFAPYVEAMRGRLADLSGRKLISMRINAGPPPSTDDAGGRILGEMCHFVDLARCLAGAAISAVTAVAASGRTGNCDDVAATIEFVDGSVASIVYTGLGDAAMSKEVIEVFCAGTVMTIDDFRSLTVAADGRRQSQRNRLGQDKGHRQELAAFMAAVRGEKPPPIDESELIETGLATIAVLESLQTGARICL